MGTYCFQYQHSIPCITKGCALNLTYSHLCMCFFRIVKLSSPYLNTLIILGIILYYIDVILFGIDKNVAPENIVDINCQVYRWWNSVKYLTTFTTKLCTACVSLGHNMVGCDWILSAVWDNAGKDVAGLLYLQECQTQEKGYCNVVN